MELKLKKNLPINEDLELKDSIIKAGESQQIKYNSIGWDTIPEYLILRLFNK